jgi:hypothetical protein
MPFRHIKDIDLETVRTMTAAYDAVVARLRLKPEDPRTGKLATIIVQLARAGVLDVDRLTEQARAGLK